jgi:hypothetical protein
MILGGLPPGTVAQCQVNFQKATIDRWWLFGFGLSVSNF